MTIICHFRSSGASCWDSFMITTTNLPFGRSLVRAAANIRSNFFPKRVPILLKTTGDRHSLITWFHILSILFLVENWVSGVGHGLILKAIFYNQSIEKETPFPVETVNWVAWIGDLWGLGIILWQALLAWYLVGGNQHTMYFKAAKTQIQYTKSNIMRWACRICHEKT